MRCAESGHKVGDPEVAGASATLRGAAARPTLSAVVICRNEARNLPGLLRCLRGWTDEIVIIDDMSEDASARIATSEGGRVRFIRHPMRAEGYAGQRNAGIDAATGDWLLHLDCDERVTAALAREIRERLPQADVDAFRYRRRNYFLHRPMRHGGWASWNHPQLARRGAHRFVGALHERCRVDGGEARIGQLEARIAHLNEASFEDRLAKSMRYVAMEAEALSQSGERVGGASLVVRPLVEFAKRYLLQRGFLDGVPGLIAALHSATAIFRTRALVWDRQNAIPRDALERQVAGEADDAVTNA